MGQPDRNQLEDKTYCVGITIYHGPTIVIAVSQGGLTEEQARSVQALAQDEVYRAVRDIQRAQSA